MVLPIENEKVWKAIKNVEVLDLFQFDSAVGAQAAKKIQPSSMRELSDANGLMRLMTGGNGQEQPIDKYVRFKNNIMLWYQEMDNYGLTKEEQEVLKPHFLKSHGVPPSQEQLMTMLMDKDICGFSLKEANAARKIVGKKQMSKIPELHQQIIKQAKSPALAKYVWDCGVGPQMGYAFSCIHALAYSFIAFQSAYIATNWNPTYWNAACLVVNSGSLEQETEEIVDIYEKEDPDCEYEDLPDRSGKKKKDKGADYGKIAKAIGTIKERGINISLININTSDFSFKPDAKNNRIIYGLKALSNINSETIDKIKAGRPYAGIKDFMLRCPLPKVATMNLIKAGAFDEVDEDFDHDRRKIMCYYISKKCDMKSKLTLQNFNGLVTHGLIPKELEMQIRVFNFNKYLKNFKNGLNYILDADAMSFFERFYSDELDLITIENNEILIPQKEWEKIYKNEMEIAKEWLKDNQKDILEEYNSILFKEVWDKYCEGTTSKWEMDSLCFYHRDHELLKVNMNRYGLSDFNTIESEEVDYYFRKNNKQIPIYKLHRIIGTVLSKDDTRHSIMLLTTTGVVNVKFTNEYYAMFKKQVSQIQSDGTKKVIEKSWFKRGSLLMIQGFRREDTFVAKNYSNSDFHQLYKIDKVLDGDITIRHERYTGNNTFEEEEYYE